MSDSCLPPENHQRRRTFTTLSDGYRTKPISEETLAQKIQAPPDSPPSYPSALDSIQSIEESIQQSIELPAEPLPAPIEPSVDNTPAPPLGQKKADLVETEAVQAEIAEAEIVKAATDESEIEETDAQGAPIDGEQQEIEPPRLSIELLELVDQKLEALIRQAGDLQRERSEIEKLEKQLQVAIEEAESKIAQSAALDTQPQFEALESRLLELEQENIQLESLYKNTRSELEALTLQMEAQNPEKLTQAVRDDCRVREAELNDEISRLRHHVVELQEVIDSAASRRNTEVDEAALATLRKQLTEAKNENGDLRRKITELSEAVKNSSGAASPPKDAWSWESQKQAWIEQLEKESADSDFDDRKRLEVEEIIQQTSENLLRKDQEIEELKNLLTEQATACQGIAVGAASFAAAIDSDALIQEERERLKILIEDWEQKQRQGEIEMSLERAKLARERLELQDKIQSVEAMQHSYSPPPSSPLDTASYEPKKTGRWLERLGLRDEAT